MIASALVAIAIVLLGYTYFGYPLLVGLLARLFAVRARRAEAAAGPGPGGEVPMISICLPVYNGAAYLPAKLDSLLGQDYPPHRMEILIYCDGCSDDSARVAQQIADSPAAAGRIRIFDVKERRGKPTALNTLGPAARGELLLLNDVRQPLSRGAARALAQAMTGDGVGCATGNLVLTGGAGSGVYWRYENWIRRQESRFRGVVGMTGPIAMVRRADLKPLPEDVVLDDVWIPMQLGLRGQRVAYVSEAEAHDAAFEDDREFKRKARTLAGNYQLFARMPALLSPFSNPFWFETISHKVLRLVAPWLMLILLGASIAGASGAGASGDGATLMRALVLAQLGFYAAAAVGARAGRLAGVARTFVVMNAAAVVGLGRHLSDRQRITW